MTMARDDLNALHGLRAMAALTVLVAHSEPLLGLGFIGNSGSVGVILFFVLSGFLMPHVYMSVPATPPRILDFTRNRFARVYPLFALTVLLSALLYFIDSSFPFKLNALEALKHLLLFGDGLTLWTISVEFQFYLAFALIWLMRSRSSDNALCTVLLVLVAMLMFTGFADGRIAPGLYMHLFAIGMLAEQVYRRVQLPVLNPLTWNVITLGLLGVYLIGFCFWTQYFGGLGMYEQVWFAGLIACLVIALTQRAQTVVARILSHPVAVTLGHWSFGIYLLHRPAYWVIDRLFADALTGMVAFAVGLGLTLIFAALAYNFMERPARKMLRAPKSN